MESPWLPPHPRRFCRFIVDSFMKFCSFNFFSSMRSCSSIFFSSMRFCSSIIDSFTRFCNSILESSLTSTSSPYHPHDHHLNPTQRSIERVLRAVGHHLRLLQRSNSNFFVLGAIGNIYTVMLSLTPSCTCPYHTVPCMHMLFVYLRVLRISLDYDMCMWRKTLRPCQLSRLLSMPTSHETMAGVTRERFHELFFRASQGGSGSSRQPVVTLEDGAMCPVCLEEMGRVDKVVAFATCDPRFTRNAYWHGKGVVGEDRLAV